MTIEEARKVWAQRSMEFRQRVKDSGLTADEYCERERKKIEQAKLTP